MKKQIKKIIHRSGYEIRRIRPKNDTEMYVQHYGQESVGKHRFYNICGAGHLGFGGGFTHPCWSNVDFERGWAGVRDYTPHRDINHDLFAPDPLPIESGSAELVHSRFTIEHITDQVAENLFKEVFRILKKGGIVKIIAPNIDLDYRAYKTSDKSYFHSLYGFFTPQDDKFMGLKSDTASASPEQIVLLHFAANASTLHKENSSNQITDEEFRDLFRKLPYQEALNYCTARCSVEIQKKYRQNHINWWNHSKLTKMLSEAGFTTVYPLSPNQSAAPVMRNPDYFDNLWNHVTFFIEAIK